MIACIESEANVYMCIWSRRFSFMSDRVYLDQLHVYVFDLLPLIRTDIDRQNQFVISVDDLQLKMYRCYH